MNTLPETILGASNVKCPICGGEGWVCEGHPLKAWESVSAG